MHKTPDGPYALTLVKEIETSKGWWSITTREGMLLFCADEAVTIVAGEIIDAMDNMEVQPCTSETASRS